MLGTLVWDTQRRRLLVIYKYERWVEEGVLLFCLRAWSRGGRWNNLPPMQVTPACFAFFVQKGRFELREREPALGREEAE